MQKLIRNVSEDGSTVQITIADERWYVKTLDDGSIIEYPSVTWIVDSYPKGIGFYKYLADKGWDNAEKIKEQAGNRGSKVHEAISLLLLGNKLSMEDKLTNSDTGELEPITLEEWEAIMSFVEWHQEVKPKTLENELTVFNEEHRYAGTADYICEIEGERWLVDFKTSKDVWPSYELQLAAYAHALPPELKPDKLAILQVGYTRNKHKKWKWNVVEDKFPLFLAAQQIWFNENANVQLKKKDYPTSLSL